MLSAVLTSPGTIAVEERPEPSPAPGEVLVRVSGVGICGTDLSIFQGKIPVKWPRVLGHELVGTLQGTKAGLKAGTRVVVDPNVYCGTCYQCTHGQENVCGEAKLMGRDRDGGLSELVAVPAINVYALPDEIDDRIAPMLQVVTVCVHAQRLTELFPQDAVAVIGLGVTGLLHVQLAKLRGAHPVIGITRSAAKRKLGEQLGADLVLDEHDPELARKVSEVTEGRGPDVVIESAGVVDTLRQAIELVRVGGRITVFGTLTATQAELPLYQLYYKEISLTNPRAARPEDFPASIELAARGALKLDPLITDTFALEETQRAIATSSDPRSLKVTLVTQAAG